MIKFLQWVFGYLVPIDEIATEILSTNEGVDFAQKFLYEDFDIKLENMKKFKDNEKNKKFKIYQPLKNIYECGG